MKQDYVLDTMARGHQKYHRLLTMLLLSELGDALRAVRFHVEDEEDYLVTWKTLWSRRVGSPIERDAHGTADFTHWGTNVRQLELYGITKDQTEWAWDAFPRLDELCLRVSPTFKGTIDHRKLNVPSASLEHLRKLELYGAWVMGIIPQADRFLRGLTNLKNLTHLIVDFDPRFPPEILHHVLSGLPNLRTIGRLGYVSRPFWRLFANRSLSHIRHLILGTSTTPHLPKVVVRRDFLADFYRDLPLGILLVCPDITRLDIFNGYREMELITPAIKRIQEGGLQVDPERKSRLRHIKVFDCAGLEESEKRELRLLVGLTVDVVQSSGWQSFGRGDAEPVRVAPKVVVQG
ncbi:hypothetical protein BC832DRAFT_591778 [Gaertneriomyces semiglobifer]|nr:hypothetical protein BC832DRAFT_591778 [Gaertneriomyces semiglobifer]